MRRATLRQRVKETIAERRLPPVLVMCGGGPVQLACRECFGSGRMPDVMIVSADIMAADAGDPSVAGETIAGWAPYSGCDGAGITPAAEGAWPS